MKSMIPRASRGNMILSSPGRLAATAMASSIIATPRRRKSGVVHRTLPLAPVKAESTLYERFATSFWNTASRVSFGFDVASTEIFGEPPSNSDWKVATLEMPGKRGNMASFASPMTSTFLSCWLLFTTTVLLWLRCRVPLM